MPAQSVAVGAVIPLQLNVSVRPVTEAFAVKSTVVEDGKTFATGIAP